MAALHKTYSRPLQACSFIRQRFRQEAYKWRNPWTLKRIQDLNTVITIKNKSKKKKKRKKVNRSLSYTFSFCLCSSQEKGPFFLFLTEGVIRWLQSPTTTTWSYTHRLRICVFLWPPSSYFDSLPHSPKVLLPRAYTGSAFFFIIIYLFVYLLPFLGLNLKYCLACRLSQRWLWVFNQLGQSLF